MTLFRNRKSTEATREVTREDKVWMHSIVKRQYMVLDDLIKFSNLYPEKLDSEIVGSLFSIYEMLRDNESSIIYSHEVEDVEGNIPTRCSRLYK